MSNASMNTTGIVSGWIERVHAGDPAARNELLRHAQHRLEVLIRRMLRRFPNVNERTGVILTGVMVRMDRAVQRTKLSTALDYFNLAGYHIRLELLDIAKQPRPLVLPPEEGRFEPQHIEDAESLAIWAEIHQWIDALSTEESELWNLIWYNGLTQNEVAEILQMPRSTMRRRWQATRLRFMEHFGKDVVSFLK
jgi:RNA polymerase sigma factor (sigma-70 family)